MCFVADVGPTNSPCLGCATRREAQSLQPLRKRCLYLKITTAKPSMSTGAASADEPILDKKTNLKNKNKFNTTKHNPNFENTA